MEKFVEALKNGDGYEFIGQHGHNLNNRDLCGIILELIYAAEDFQRQEGYKNEIQTIAANNLKERFDYLF